MGLKMESDSAFIVSQVSGCKHHILCQIMGLKIDSLHVNISHQVGQSEIPNPGDTYDKTPQNWKQIM